MPQPDLTADLNRALAERILVLDGAMGTTIRSYGLSETDARGSRFAAADKDLFAWVADLHDQHGISVARAILQRNDGGTIRVQLTFSDGAR